MLRPSIVYNSHKIETTKYLSVDEGGQQNVTHIYKGMLLSLKKEENLTHARIRMDVTLNEINYSQKDKYSYDSTYTAYLTKSKLYRQKVEWWLVGLCVGNVE